MSSIVIQVGQCGNQMGHTFWEHALKDLNEDRQIFRHGEADRLRSVHVDSEGKVVRKLLKAAKKSNFQPGSIVLGQRGRGSNWAMGYHDRHDTLLIDTMEAVRKEVERCDSFCGSILMHSLSGGTGSGFGSRLSEAIRDEYPLNYILSCTVAPHRGGESPLQNYNSLLCLAALQRQCDGILLFNNDTIFERVHPLDRDVVNISDMNQHIADCLTALLLPTDTTMPSNGMSLGMEPWELLRSLCPMPSHKFMQTNHVNKSKVSWSEMCSMLLRSIPRRDEQENLVSLLSCLLVARGDSTGSFFNDIKSIEGKFKQSYRCVSWNPFLLDVWTDRNSLPTKKHASLTMAVNTSCMVDFCKHILQRSQAMMSAGAYLHWYWKHGCQQSDFDEAVNTVSDIVAQYKDAGR